MKTKITNDNVVTIDEDKNSTLLHLFLHIHEGHGYLK